MANKRNEGMLIVGAPDKGLSISEGGLYPPPSDSLPLGEGGHVFPSPLMGEGQGEGVDSFPAFPQ